MRRRSLAGLAGALVLTIACAPSASGFGYAVDGDVVTLGAPSRQSLYPHVAGAGTRIHALWFQPFGGLSARMFTDGGRTPGPIATVSKCLSTCITDSWRIAAAGTHVWATWVQLDPDEQKVSREQVYLAASEDSGDTWGPPQRLSDLSSVSWFARIAAEGDRAHVVWNDSKGLRLRTIDGTVPRADTLVLDGGARPSTARVAATEQVFGAVTVAWESGSTQRFLNATTSLDGGTTFPVTEVWPDRRLEGLAVTPTHIRMLASLPPQRPVILMSSALVGGDFSDADLSGAQACALGCSGGDVAASGTRAAVAWHNDGGVFVTRTGPGGTTTARVGSAPLDSGWPQVAMTETTTGVVWNAAPSAEAGDGFSLVSAGATHDGAWSAVSPKDFYGLEPKPNSFIPDIAGLGTGFGIAYMNFNTVDSFSSADFVVQPAYRHTDGGEPNLKLVEAKVTQAVDGAQLIRGKATAIVAKVSNTTGRARNVKVQVTTDNDAVSGPTATVSRRIAAGTSTIVVPSPDDPLRPTGTIDFGWSVKLDSGETIEETDETDNAAEGVEPVADPVPALRVLFVPVRIGVSALPSCGGVGAQDRQVEAVLAGREMGDAVLPFDERKTSWAVSCSGLRYPGPKVDARAMLHDLHSMAFAGDRTKIVGVVEDGFFKNLQTDPKLVSPVGLAFDSVGSGFYRCRDGIIMESGAAAGASPALRNGTVPTHEILHTAGFQHTAAVPAPGTWVRQGRRIPPSYIDLMNPQVGAEHWIAKSVFDGARATVLQATPGCDTPASKRVLRAAGTPVRAATPVATLAIGGAIDAAGVVTPEPFYERVAEPDVSLGGAGPVEARLLDSGGATLGSAFVTPGAALGDGDADAPDAGVGAFRLRVPVPAGTQTVQLYRDGIKRFERSRSATAPEITVSGPNGGERFVAGDEITVDWAASDGDGDTLHHLVAISGDDGATWSPLAADVTGSSYAFTASDSMVSDAVRVRVEVTDGWRTASDASDATFEIVARTTDGRIVYATDAGKLMTIEPDGSDVQTLTPVAVTTASDPEWSPDGTQVVFARGNLGLWLIDADGTNLHQLVAPAACVGGMREPDWSPDGTQVVFVETDCGITVRRVNADGTGLVDLGISGDKPAWSPLGDRIAIQHQDPLVPGSTLSFITPDGQLLSSIELNDAGPGVDWSPDAARIAYTGTPDNFVWTADPDGTNRTRLGPPPPYPNGNPAYWYGPHWSPGGDRMVFWQEPQYSQLVTHDLWVQNADGSEAVQITHDNKLVRENDPDWQALPAPRDSIAPDAGGPYTGPEGSAVALTAAASTATAAISGYAWDLDGDGDFDDATGVTTSTTPDDDGTQHVAVRVTDANGQSAVDAAELTATNVAPAVSFAAAGTIGTDGTARLTARIADPGADEQTVTVDFNDGTAPQAATYLARAGGGGDILELHDYAGGGVHTATVHTDDGDGGTHQATTGFTARAANRPPSVGDAAGGTVAGQPVLVALAVDDADSDTVDLALGSAPAHGVAEIIGSERDLIERRVIYTPSPGFVGDDSFTVAGADGRGGTDAGTVSITVSPLPGTVADPVLTPGPGVTTPFVAPPAIAADAACANDRLQVTDVYPDGGRVRIRGVAPAATRGQTVAIVFAATGRQVASAVVAPDLSFTATAPLPPRRLRTSDRARYLAAVGRSRSPAIKLARRMFLRSVTRSATGVRISGQVVKPLARRAKDRNVTVIVATNCARTGGRRVTFAPSASGRFSRTIALTKAELGAAAVYLRAQTKVRSGRRVLRTYSLTRGVAVH
jgi:Tol biopolymer transport system component